MTVETEAHKAVTSRYNFNADIFPIVRDNCGRCHGCEIPALFGRPLHEGEKVDAGAFKALIRAAVALNISGGKAKPGRAK